VCCSHSCHSCGAAPIRGWRCSGTQHPSAATCGWHRRCLRPWPSSKRRGAARRRRGCANGWLHRSRRWVMCSSGGRCAAPRGSGGRDVGRPLRSSDRRAAPRHRTARRSALAQLAPRLAGRVATWRGIGPIDCRRTTGPASRALPPDRARLPGRRLRRVGDGGRLGAVAEHRLARRQSTSGLAFLGWVLLASLLGRFSNPLGLP
jgi:hypothetical protein